MPKLFQPPRSTNTQKDSTDFMDADGQKRLIQAVKKHGALFYTKEAVQKANIEGAVKSAPLGAEYKSPSADLVHML